ncbi:hypothetical protein [Burkholderia territorii]|uniref:hypothetical protein n=1 Tax=Burkholderia territorii TaxID=1503055 RepID=UPI000B1653B5|nr:hypothetical protein [Burkholderia territorii]
MNTVPKLRVTIDTNVCDILHEPDKSPELMIPDDARRLRQAIADGTILAFAAEATLFVECLAFKDKLAYLAVAGTPDPRPSPDPRAVDRFRDLNALGVKILHAPLMAGEVFIHGLEYADDTVFTTEERRARFGEFTRRYPGRHPIASLGLQLLSKQPPLPATRQTGTSPNSVHFELRQDWAVALQREWNNPITLSQKALRKQAGTLIGEWCDTLIVGAHYGYGNDFFCTTDEGRGAGSNSILFHQNRSRLASEGIVVTSPAELVGKIG